MPTCSRTSAIADMRVACAGRARWRLRRRTPVPLPAPIARPPAVGLGRDASTHRHPLLTQRTTTLLAAPARLVRQLPATPAAASPVLVTMPSARAPSGRIGRLQPPSRPRKWPRQWKSRSKLLFNRLIADRANFFKYRTCSVVSVVAAQPLRTASVEGMSHLNSIPS